MAATPLHPLPLLGAVLMAPVAGVNLVLAQVAEEAGPAAVASPPASAAAPVAAPLQPPAEPPAAPPPLTARPAAAEPARPPKRFDAIVEEKLYTPPRALAPSDYARPSGNIRLRGPVEGSGKSIAQLCAEGALEAYRCGGGSHGQGQVGVAFTAPGAQAPGSLAFAGPRSGIDASPLPPISVPVTALLSGNGGSFRLADVFRVTPRPRPVAGNGNSRLLFPLIGSAITSSGFGWRLHPILGSWLMHAGRDLAAPEGTPVVAALSGRVVSSGLAGGYGLAVEIEHDRPRRRTLYGHLSELYVKEGEMVRQGEVIGRVGSTGLSTGPHLHFELRQPSSGGWVAVDPGDFDAAGTLLADGGGRAGEAGPSDAVALLMAQLVQTLERPVPAAAPRG
jgi:murein DD-endopeptidase MepM/ murein hydrolase activator NlpD